MEKSSAASGTNAGLPPAEPSPPGLIKRLLQGRTPVKKKAIRAPEVLNEASGLDPYPASTGVQAGLCRKDLLLEMEAVAMIVR